MNIHSVEKFSSASWNNYVQKHPRGLSYHLTSWQESVQEAYGFEYCSLVAVESGNVCGILPLIKFKMPWQRRTMISLPYCDAAGVLADNQAIASALINHALELAATDKCKCQIRSTESLPIDCENFTDKVRMVLELPGSSKELFAGFRSKVRSQVRKPLRDGLIVKFGGTELLDHFSLIFSENMRDLGSPVHSRQWLNAIIKHYGTQARVAVVYTSDQQPAAAGIILKHPFTVSIPWASSLRRYNSLNPNMLLYWTFLAHAADNGHRYFDFGRSTPGEGTYRFKEQWGAVPQQLYWYEWPEKVEGCEITLSIKSNIRNICENIWCNLPLFLTNKIGPVLRKYISL